MAIKAVLFDIDGTLVDSNDYHVEAWQAVFDQIGATFDDQVVHDQIGKGTDMLVPTLLPDTDEAEQERMGEEHGRIFKSKYLEQVMPFAAARDLLAKVKKSGRQVVLASSASSEELEHYIRLMDAGEIVGVSTTSDDVERDQACPRHLFHRSQEAVAARCQRGDRRRGHAVRHRSGRQVRHCNRRRPIGQVQRRYSTGCRRCSAVRRRRCPAG